MKAPQIIRIYNQKQTGGINLTSLLLDLIKFNTLEENFQIIKLAIIACLYCYIDHFTFIPFGTPISLSSKCLQLFTILKFKNADSISLTSWFISAYTNGARIYTISMDSADKIMLTNFCLNTSLSTSILLAKTLEYETPKTQYCITLSYEMK
ncbi:hypothetical protein ACI65C_012699 [Semiaphis heraclei]